MFSEHMGTIIAGESGDQLKVRAGAAGHAVYGPYENLRPGLYRVDFTVSCEDGAAAGERHVATLDIAALSGTVILARREIVASDLSAKPRTFSLFLTLREFRGLEYRVDSTGAAELLVGTPRVTSLGQVTEPQAETDPNEDTPDPIELNRKIRRVLRLLQPYRAPDFAKIRLGHGGDGGYVMLDDFAGIDTALSFGINDDISWDLDAADRSMTIHQFDHTVEDPAPDDRRMVFNKKMIGTHSSDTTAALADLIRQHDRGTERPNMLLKMDIEGGEWPMLESTPTELLGRLSQIVCEFHYFDWIGHVEQRRQLWHCLSKVHEHFAVVHVHANVVGRSSLIAGVFVPHTLEFTFVNRALYRLEESNETFPGPMDSSCDPNAPDLWLGSFRY